MNKSTNRTDFALGKIAGQEIYVTQVGIAGAVALWVILAAIAYLVIKLPLGPSIAGGFIGMVLHWFSDLWHQLGHAYAARNTGHPMTGIRFGFLGILSTSLYPADEEKLPPSVHIRRALGGPLASLALSVIAEMIFVIVNTGRTGGTIWWLALLFVLENFVVFTLQVFLPLGFNDGSTILYWWRIQQQQR